MADGLIINELLANEVKGIENEVFEKVQGKEEKEQPSAPPPEKTPDKKTKAELIADLHGLQKAVGAPLADEKKLKRMTKNELIKIMGSYLDGSYVNTLKPEEKKPEEKPEEKKQESAETFDNITNAMLRMNLVACMLLETTSQTMKHKTYDIPLLQGFTEEINRQESHLKPIFAQIYMKYKSQLDYVLSPMAQYALVMSSSVVTVVNKNVNEKKKESSETSKIEVVN